MKRSQPTNRPRLPVVQSDDRYAETYAARKRIADEATAELAAAVAACGPGADAYAKWRIVDKLRLLPDRVIYCCTRPTTRGWEPGPDFPERGERVGSEHDPGFEVKGVVFRLFRFETRFSACAEYRPQTPAQMKAAAERRRDEALAKQESQEQRERDARSVDERLNPTLFAWAGVSEGPKP